MNSLLIKADAVRRLGVTNVGRVMLYKLGLKLGFNPVRRLNAPLPRGPFFNSSVQNIDVRTKPRVGWFQYYEAFGQPLGKRTNTPPQWLASCLSAKKVKGSEKQWWEIPDFDPVVGDIKTVWEFSRFDWVLASAQNYLKGDESSLESLNNWLADWCRVNPPYRGPNWKCGQEASIRVMHLAMAAYILNQVKDAAPGLLNVVEVHLRRIAPTVLYAKAQDNNHGTSEAVALFIGGSWLEANGRADGEKFTRSGRTFLENCARRLIEKDGSFSQHSLNYHRVMLDSFSMAELWRRKLDLPSFCSEFYTRAASASEWLRYLIQDFNGDGPNLGANDGARLLPLTDTVYRDYRPSVQLATALFHDAYAFSGEGAWNQPLYWLRIPLPKTQMHVPESVQFDDGGYFVLRQEPVMVLLRYPRFRFRPSQADALHCDLWVGGENLLRDAGTYSYNTDQRWLDYFPGTVAHNTVQFDDRDQMPRLGRFLFGAWLKSRNVQPLTLSDGKQSCGAGYRDWKGATHDRHIELQSHSLHVTDQLDGFDRKAVLRWRLKPGHWTVDVDNLCIKCGDINLKVASTMEIIRFQIVEGWESLYYLKKSSLPVLEIEVAQPGTLSTTIEWVKE